MDIEETHADRRREETRLIAMGSAALVEGFSLIGFETHPNATPQELEAVLKELVRKQHKALVILEHPLACSGTATLTQVRAEGGRIVVVEVPPLHTPNDYHPQVEELVQRILGPSALKE